MRATTSLYLDVNVTQAFKQKHGDKTSHKLETFMIKDLGLSDGVAEATTKRYTEAYRLATPKQRTECKIQYEYYKSIEKIPQDMFLSEYFAVYYIQEKQP